MANAALKISVNGQVDPQGAVILAPSETVMIDVAGIAPQPGNYSLWLVASPAGAGGLTGGSIVWPYNDTTLSSFQYYTGTDEAHIMLLNGPGMNLGVDSGLFIVAATTIAPTPEYTGTIADGIIFHCNNFNNVTLTLLHVIQTDTGEVDENFDPIFTYSPEIFDTQVIQQIPEPFTMGLLGLGGLFLRRRK